MLTGMIFASDMRAMERFYSSALGLDRVAEESSEDFIVLAGDGARVALHALPDHVAERVVVEDPPRPREEVAIKLLFAVADPDAVVERALASGGRVGHRAEGAHTDLLDPEGNVLRVHPLG